MVRPRHYAPFAAWLTEGYGGYLVPTDPAIFRVQDPATGQGWDVNNSRLS